MDNMPTKENLPPGNQTWAEENPDLAALSLIQRNFLADRRTVELSPTVNIPQNIEVTEEAKPQFIRNWRKAIINGWKPDVIEQEIKSVQQLIAGGVSPNKLRQIKLDYPQRGKSEVASVAQLDYLNELLLAQLVHQEPEEVARQLRLREGLVLKEIDDFQKTEAGIGMGNQRFAGNMTNLEYSQHLERIQQLIENPPELIAFRNRLEALKKEFGESYLQRMASRFRRYQITGQMPSREDLQAFVPLEEAMRLLRPYLPNGEKVDIETIQRFKAEEDEMKRAELAKQMGLGMPQEAIGGEYYISMYEKAWKEFNEALIPFPPEVQDEIVANFIFDGCILGGQFPNFYKKAVQEKGRYPSKWTPWLDAIEFFQKTGQMKGYQAMEQVFQMLGSTEPEILGFPDFHTAHHELQFAGEDQIRKFDISSRDMIGVLGRLETMAKLGINNAYTSEIGFFDVRNGEFAAYLLRQMGFEPDLAHNIAYGKAMPPSMMIRDNKLSPVNRAEVHHLWDWVGETALAKLVVAMAWLKWTRADLEFAPLDMKRRQMLSLRGLELADYRLGYAIGMPPEQFLSMIAVFGSAISIDHKPMLRWVRGKFSENVNPEIAKQRQEIWDQTITLNRPAIASTREMAKMATGMGEYKQTGDEYRKAVKSGMGNLPSGQVQALRHPDLWKWRWFENCDQDSSKWRYIGNINGGPTVAQTETAFAGYDFTDELRACGLSENELQKLDRNGIEGWKNLLNSATFGLLEWQKMGYTTGDKNLRYEHKKEGLQDASVEFLRTSTGEEPRALSAIERPRTKTVNNLPEVSPDKFEKELVEIFGKLLGAISGTTTFVPNETQKAYCQAIIKMYIEGHAGHKLSALVEDLKLDSLKDGDNFSVVLLTKADIPVSRIPALMQAGFYFQRDLDKGVEYLISPLCAPVPKLVTAETLLTNIGTMLTEITSQGKKLSSRQGYLQKAVNFMKDEKKYFCWDTLISGSADVPLGSLLKALKDSKIANFGGATYHAIEEDIARFARDNQNIASLISPESKRSRLY